MGVSISVPSDSSAGLPDLVQIHCQSEREAQTGDSGVLPPQDSREVPQQKLSVKTQFILFRRRTLSGVLFVIVLQMSLMFTEKRLVCGFLS